MPGSTAALHDWDLSPAIREGLFDFRPPPGAKRVDMKTLLEGGEGETFVLDAPFFNKRIVVDEVEKQWDGLRGVVWIKKGDVLRDCD
jgi:diphthamide synthase (EF-2-diphthine--ammonia ligase)